MYVICIQLILKQANKNLAFWLRSSVIFVHINSVFKLSMTGIIIFFLHELVQMEY